MTNRVEVSGVLPDMTLELSTGAIRVTQWPRVKPRPGGPLWESYGICAHPNFDNEAYGDTDAWTHKVAVLGAYAFRGMCASQLHHVKRTLVRCEELGLKWLATVASEKTTEMQLRANLQYIAAHPDVFIGVEGINEPDGEGLTEAEVAKTVRFQAIIKDFVDSHPELSHLVVLSPALRRPATRLQYQRFADAGILGTFDVVSLHHYNSGGGNPFRPNPPNVADLGVHLDMVQEVWGCDRFWVTEGGNTNVLHHADPRRAPEEASAAYSIPTLLEFLSDPRVEKYFRYELLDDRDPESDDNEAHFGLWRADGSPKPEASAMAWFLSLLRDSEPYDPAEVEVEVVAPQGVRRQVIQASGQAPVVWLWRPGVPYDAEPVDVQILTPAGTRTVNVGGAAVGVPLNYEETL